MPCPGFRLEDHVPVFLFAQVATFWAGKFREFIFPGMLVEPSDPAPLAIAFNPVLDRLAGAIDQDADTEPLKNGCVMQVNNDRVQQVGDHPVFPGRNNPRFELDRQFVDRLWKLIGRFAPVDERLAPIVIDGRGNVLVLLPLDFFVPFLVQFELDDRINDLRCLRQDFLHPGLVRFELGVSDDLAFDRFPALLVLALDALGFFSVHHKTGMNAELLDLIDQFLFEPVSNFGSFDQHFEDEQQAPTLRFELTVDDRVPTIL